MDEESSAVGYDSKVDFSEYGDESTAYNDYVYHDEDEKEDEAGYFQNTRKDGDESVGVLSSTCEGHLHDDRGRAEEAVDDDSEDGQATAGIKLSEKDERRLLGAFLLASDGGLGGGGEKDGKEAGGDEEPRLSTDGPSCLKKFTTIAASLGLKTTREKLREDFEEVVRSNQLVTTSPGDPWLGAHDTTKPVVGFTYKIFRRYYLAKIQGELLEVNIRQAWEDLHTGTGSKYMPSNPPASDSAAREASSTLSGGMRQPPQHYSNRDSEHQGRGLPYVARAELHMILTRDGECLTDEEVEQLLRECKPDEEGRIVYEGYRRMLIDPSL